MAGDAFSEQFTVGTADEVVKEVEQLVATGVDCLIFNMPLTDAVTVARAGELLVSRFA
jgi:alkanesulfonate monooxygenase SsuD/methylene tetrahydromethanopterin reductase-like flavin-dependent oxidoreductase (luciferase family)